MKPLSFRVIISAMLACLFVFATEAQSTAVDVSCDPAALVAAINAANTTPEADTLNLAADCVYSFTSAADIDATLGNSALPRITTPVTINGNGATLRRDVIAPNLRLMRVETTGSLSLNNLTITGGKGLNGTGVYNYGLLNLTTVVMSGNNAHYLGADGGAIANHSNAILNIDRSTFTENSANDFGGAIANRADGGPGIIRIRNSTFSGNSAHKGGGIANNGGDVVILESIFSGNAAISNGGGAIASGGAIGISSGQVNIFNSVISGNTGPHGGGISKGGDGALNIVNSVLSGNRATEGGGLRNFTGPVTIVSSTISGNSADVGGGIAAPGGIYLYNNILWGNSSQISGSGIVGINNIIEAVTGTGDPNANVLFVSPVSHMLAPTTAGDYRVQANSPALNLGNNSMIPVDQHDLDRDANTNEPVPYDLDGNPRVVNGTVDIGAYEHQTPALVALSKNTISLSEGAATDTYNVVLASKPAASVTVTPTGDSQCTVSAPLTFTTDNWNTPQEIIVTAVNDAAAEGDHTCIITHAAASGDTAYDSISVTNVTGNITDDDPFTSDLLLNGGFETNEDTDKIPDGWTLKYGVGEKQVCKAVKAHSGSCAFKFKGGAGENAKLVQTVDLSAAALNEGDTLRLSAYFRAANTIANAKLILKIIYSGGPLPAVTKHAVKQNAAYTLIGLPDVAITGPVAKITVTVKHKSLSGALWLDDISLIHTSALRVPGILPPPRVPEGFRGTN